MIEKISQLLKNSFTSKSIRIISHPNIFDKKKIFKKLCICHTIGL
jgi:hypothetical protein